MPILTYIARVTDGLFLVRRGGRAAALAHRHANHSTPPVPHAQVASFDTAQADDVDAYKQQVGWLPRARAVVRGE